MYSMPVALMTSTMKSEPGLPMIFSPGSPAAAFFASAATASAATVLAAAMLVLMAAALFRKLRRSSPSSLMAFSVSFARPIHEAVAVRHLYLRQRSGIHLIVLRDDGVQVKQVCRHRVRLVIRERLWIGERHGAARVVEKRGRIRPEAAHRAQGIGGRERADAARERVGRLAHAFGAMTGLALRQVDSLALLRVAATRGQSLAARRDADVPRRHLLRGRSASELCVGPAAGGRICRAGGEREAGDQAPRRKHWRCFRRPRPPRSGSSCCDNAAAACIA